ncbi:MAG: Por secretion system protein, partial [Prevotella sp.]|nr:Por secretion system protein [Prevotella sp.]
MSAVLLGLCLIVRGQQFFNLTADEVRIDSVLPLFSHIVPLGAAYADSVYEVSIEYPEFIDMSEADIRRVREMTTDTLPALPHVDQYIGISRRRASLYVSLVPLVCRDGRYQKLVSFKLAIRSRHVAKARGAAAAGTDGRYAAHSVLATGRWAKIRVPSSGVYQLTDAVIRQAGFSDISRVKVYGYGGAMQPEALTASYLSATDDLQQVPLCTVGSRRLFYAQGPVSWSSTTVGERTRNPYSSYGYYFITENDSAALTQTAEQLQTAHYPNPTYHHSLYETDDYAWFQGGRNLYDSRLLGAGVSR